MPGPQRGEIVRQIGDALRQYKAPLGRLVSYYDDGSHSDNLNVTLTIPKWSDVTDARCDVHIKPCTGAAASLVGLCVSSEFHTTGHAVTCCSVTDIVSSSCGVLFRYWYLFYYYTSLPVMHGLWTGSLPSSVGREGRGFPFALCVAYCGFSQL